MPLQADQAVPSPPGKYQRRESFTALDGLRSAQESSVGNAGHFDSPPDLGGLQTDLSGRVLSRGPAHGPVPGLFAAGEVAGFGGGGMHGYRSLEGSFLGGCLFSGRQAGRAAAAETGAAVGRNQ